MPPGPKNNNLGPYPSYLGPGRPGSEHLSPFNNLAPSPYARPPLLGYDSHPHSRAPGLTANGIGTMSGGKP